MKKLNMRKKLGIEGFPKGPINYKKITDVLMIVKDLQRVDFLDPDEVEDLAGNLYTIFGDDTLSDAILDVHEDKASIFIQMIGEYLSSLSTKIELKPRGKELLGDLIKVCQDPNNPKYQIKKVPLEEVFGPKKEKEEFEETEEPEVGEEWKEKLSLKERIRKEMVVPSKEPLSKTPLTKVIEKYTPEILQKYTEDEIWDIASGKKTDVTEEEIEQAKEVIQRGIVANRLNMRKIAQDKLTTKDLKRFYDLERKGLLTDEFADDILSKLLYGLQDYAVGSRVRKGYVRKYISDLEKAYTRSLNEKIIAIDQVVSEFHRDMMPQLIDEFEDPNKVNKALDDLFYGYAAVLDHARDEIRRLKSEGETPTVENIIQHLEDYWSFNTKLNARVVKELLESGEIQQEAFNLSMRKTSQSAPEVIQKAQQGDKDAIAKVVEENESLVASSLIKWGLTPGSDEFQDTLSDIKVEMLNRIIPQYDSSKGAFSTFLTTAVFNFLRRGTRKKEYEEKQKEVSTEEPNGVDITLGVTLEDKSHPLVQMTISSARENLQDYIHTKNPELEDMILRIFDLKIEDNTHEQIAEFLNKEGFKSKGKPITRFIVNNLVNEWIKPALVQFFEAFKTAKLNMRNKMGQSFYEIDPAKIFPTFEREQAIDTVTRYLQAEFSSKQIRDLIVKGKLYDYIYYTLAGMYSHLVDKKQLSNDALRQLTQEMVTKWEVEGSPLSIPTDIKELTKADPVVRTFLQKYTPDEIFDIASGKKTDVTEEEIEQAKEVISRGIVANRLSMRKEGSRE